MKNMISLDNGHTWISAEEAMPEITERNLWDAIVDLMDDDVREDVNFDLAPCTDLEFLAEYLNRAEEGLVIG